MRAARIPPRAIVTLVLVLTTAAVAAVGASSARDPGDAERSLAFQRLVGGLGWGVAIDLSACRRAYDPRLGQACPDAVGPLPGGIRHCPHFGGPEGALR